MLSKVQANVLATAAELATVNLDSQPMPETPRLASETILCRGIPLDGAGAADPVA